VGDAVHDLGLVGFVEVGPVVGEQFGVAEDRGEGIADLVAEHADEVEFELVGVFEFAVAAGELCGGGVAGAFCGAAAGDVGGDADEVVGFAVGGADEGDGGLDVDVVAAGGRGR